MKSNEDDFQKKLLRFKLMYNGAKLVDNFQSTIDYILEDKYSAEQYETIRQYKLQNKNVRTVNEAFFIDILEKKNPFFYQNF